MNALERLGQLGVIPVVKIDQAKQGPNLAEALLEGGLPCAEITFRTNAAEEAIRLISASHPGVIVGAGTVISISQAQKAVGAGARFIISPGFDPKVVDWCLKQNVPVVPGVATPTEALMALDKGLNILKFFPCESLGGIPMLEAIAAALVGVKFIPTGGITDSNMASYLKLSMVYAVAGSWMATPKLITSGAFEEITRLASKAVAIVRQERKNGEETWLVESSHLAR
jgi:2-dehydro-3-deoxyphosphogluconate aldolase / (4S)-4-hydroxy-2-oxoglutarate aldolase